MNTLHEALKENKVEVPRITLKDDQFSRLKTLQTILTVHYGLIVSIEQLVHLVLSHALTFDDPITYYRLIAMIISKESGRKY